MEEKQNNKIYLRFNSIPENVGLARLLVAAVAANADITMSQLEEIKVSVSEAVSNAIIHGYANEVENDVELTVELKDNILQVQVIDQGVGIEDIEKAMEATFSTDSDRMGLGFAFMQSFMDNVEVISSPGAGTTVILTKRLSAGGQ